MSRTYVHGSKGVQAIEVLTHATDNHDYYNWCFLQVLFNYKASACRKMTLLAPLRRPDGQTESDGQMGGQRTEIHY